MGGKFSCTFLSFARTAEEESSRFRIWRQNISSESLGVSWQISFHFGRQMKGIHSSRAQPVPSPQVSSLTHTQLTLSLYGYTLTLEGV